MAGARLLEDCPDEVVVIHCDTCGRHGRYRKATLISRFGPKMAMPSILTALAADCPNGVKAAGGKCYQPYFVRPGR